MRLFFFVFFMHINCIVFFVDFLFIFRLPRQCLNTRYMLGQWRILGFWQGGQGSIAEIEFGAF